MSMSPSSSGHVNMMKGQPFHVKYREIIRRMSFLIGALLVFRLGAHIPVPGINNAALENLFHANQGTILGLFNMFSGGALERMSILALGIMPYISASIIVQLMSTVIPSLEALKRKGSKVNVKLINIRVRVHYYLQWFRQWVCVQVLLDRVLLYLVVLLFIYLQLHHLSQELCS